MQFILRLFVKSRGVLDPLVKFQRRLGRDVAEITRIAFSSESSGKSLTITPRPREPSGFARIFIIFAQVGEASRCCKAEVSLLGGSRATSTAYSIAWIMLRTTG
jgi:hypothetical protein